MCCEQAHGVQVPDTNEAVVDSRLCPRSARCRLRWVSLSKRLKSNVSQSRFTNWRPVLCASINISPLTISLTALIWSLAVLDPRVGHTTDVLSPFIPVLCRPDWLFDGESPTENLKSEHVQSNRPIHTGTADTTKTGPSILSRLAGSVNWALLAWSRVRLFLDDSRRTWRHPQTGSIHKARRRQTRTEPGRP